MRAWIVLVLPLLAPIAAAQPPPDPFVTFEMESPPPLVAPETQQVRLEWRLRWSCSQAEVQSGGAEIETEFRLTTRPDHLTLVLAPTTQITSRIPVTECTDDTLQYEV